MKTYRIVNFTANPIELHLPTGVVLLPARGSLPLTHEAVAHSQLQRLIAQGVVRLMPVTNS